MQVPIEGSLVGRVVENMQELRAAQVKHDLRIHREELAEAERARIFVAKVAKALAKPDEHAVKPAKNVAPFIHFGLKDGDAGHQSGSGVLVKGGNDVLVIDIRKHAGLRSYTQPELASRMLIIRDELYVAEGTGSWRSLTGHFKVHAKGCARSDRADPPSRRPANANFLEMR